MDKPREEKWGAAEHAAVGAGVGAAGVGTARYLNNIVEAKRGFRSLEGARSRVIR